MANRKHLLHVKSNVVEKAKQYGIDDFLVTPKKPVDPSTGKATDDTLLYGEIAVNYGKGVEALIIRNTENNVVTFVNENDFHEAGEIIADGIATEKLEREEADAAETAAREAETAAREAADTAEIAAREAADATEKSAREAADATEAAAREEAELVAANAFACLDEKVVGLDEKVVGLDEKVVGLDEKIDTSVISKMVSITYDEIKVLREQSKLKPGQFYRITDYVTITTQENTTSAGHVFDVIVLATDVDTLNENAKAIKHEGDAYFANSDLDAWEIKYDLDNDITKYAWADETNGKGVIFYMKDEWNNECPYDFKNIQFKRYKLKNQSGLHLADEPLTYATNNYHVKQAFTNWQNILGSSMSADNVSFYYSRGVYNRGYLVSGAEIYNYNPSYASYDERKLVFDENSNGIYIGICSVYDSFDIIAEVEDTNGEWFYTFSKKDSATDIAVDASLNKLVSNNSIKNYINDGIYYLNNNIFIRMRSSLAIKSNNFNSDCYNNTFGNCHFNTFGNNCYANTFGNGCYANTFGNNCYYNVFYNAHTNTFGYGCYANTFGNIVYSNTFGYDCYANTFGDSCYNNTFGNNCYYNTFELNNNFIKFGNSCYSNYFPTGCYSNIFGYNCYSNEFGANCYFNTFNNKCYENRFGDRCYSNTFGNSCYNNTFGDNNDNNTFGNNCYYNVLENSDSTNTFGSNVQHIRFEKDYMYYNIVENGNKYITVTSTETTGSNQVLRNFTIAQGVNNGVSEGERKTISHNTVNDTFKTTYQNANSKTVNV